MRRLIRRVTLFLSRPSGPATHTGRQCPGSGRQADMSVGGARDETGAASGESSLEVANFFFFSRLYIKPFTRGRAHRHVGPGGEGDVELEGGEFYGGEGWRSGRRCWFSSAR